MADLIEFYKKIKRKESHFLPITMNGTYNSIFKECVVALLDVFYTDTTRFIVSFLNCYKRERDIHSLVREKVQIKQLQC